MEKPISMRLQEAKENIVTIITESGLPMWMLEPAVKDQVNTVAAQEMYNDRKQYVEDLKKEKEIPEEVTTEYVENLQKEKEVSEEVTTECDENQTVE